jgi:hypothetical protein
MKARSGIETSWTIARVLTGIATIVAVYFLRSETPVDDAYITYRYAYNLAHHYQLTFNVNDYVEAQTNFLWSVILSPFTLSSFPIEYVALFISAICLVFVVVRIFDIALLFEVSLLASVAVAACLVVSVDFIRAGTNGLEAALYMAVITEMIYSYLKGRLYAAYALAGACFLVRPEGAAFGVLLFFLQILSGKAREAAKPFSVFVLVALSLTAFRFYYYNSVIPNSVVAKSLDLRFVFSHPGGALKYLWDFGVFNAGLALAFLVSLYLAAISFQRRNRCSNVVVLSCGMIALSYVIAFRNYGDWMENHRLLIQYMPLYAVVLLYFSRKEFDHILQIPRANTSVVVLVLCASLASTFHFVANEKLWSHAYNDSHTYGDADVPLAGVLRPADVVSAEALGLISYKLIEAKFHDPLGLADPVLARRGAPVPRFGKGDINYTLGTIRPSILFWHSPWHIPYARKDLLENYIARCIFHCTSLTQEIVMIRKDRAADLDRYPDLPLLDLQAVRPNGLVPVMSAQKSLR